MNAVLLALSGEYDIWAPKTFPGGANVSGLDLVRYGKIERLEEAVFDKKSANSFREALVHIGETLFYFTENDKKVPDEEAKKPLIFLRACDLHAIKRLDLFFLGDGKKSKPDFYYERVRNKAKFVLMPCDGKGETFESCFCVDMGANKPDDAGVSYEFAVLPKDGAWLVDCKTDLFSSLIKDNAESEVPVTTPFVTENKTHIRISDKIASTPSPVLAKLPLWDEYDSRCVNCGRCNFACPTCTCWSMQDLCYSENSNAGERRRVWSSCMVDHFTDVAGGGAYRKKNGERMRNKVLHKVRNFKERFGMQMCVGCGRCDDVCPEYISFVNTVVKLSDAVEEDNER
jgi:anaerobic sulfite reductase subunit A